MVVKIVPGDISAPADKVADAELVFDEGVLSGMKLVGFTIWKHARQTNYSVTFPARQYVANGERRSYLLLRPVAPGGSQDALRLMILQAYADYQALSEGGHSPESAAIGLSRSPGVERLVKTLEIDDERGGEDGEGGVSGDEGARES